MVSTISISISIIHNSTVPRYRVFPLFLNSLIHQCFRKSQQRLIFIFCSRIELLENFEGMCIQSWFSPNYMQKSQTQNSRHYAPVHIWYYTSHFVFRTFATSFCSEDLFKLDFILIERKAQRCAVSHDDTRSFIARIFAWKLINSF